MEEYISCKNEVVETLLKKDPPQISENTVLLKKLCSDSRPDAWIYDRDFRFIILIETKTKDAILFFSQIISHAFNWLGISNPEEILNRIIKVRWVDIIHSVDEMKKKRLKGRSERLLLELVDYLEWNKIRPFRGFLWKDLKIIPQFELKISGFRGFKWDELKVPIEIFGHE